jgi:hypothetical protein
MKLYEILPLFEARKNPENNPKFSPYEQLVKYKDDPNVYISFTTVNKLGLNPVNRFDTPTGIYSYPLSVVWTKYNIDKRKSMRVLPFATNRKYIQVFRRDDAGRFVDGLENYDDIDLDNDLSILRRMYKNKEDIIQHAIKSAYGDTDFGKFWNVTRLLADKNPNEWASILRGLGYSGFNDATGTGLIHHKEPFQAVFLKKSGVKHIGTILNDATAENKPDKFETSKDAVRHLLHISKGRSKKVERKLIKHGNYWDMFTYARFIIKGRWEPLEQKILQDIRYKDYLLNTSAVIKYLKYCVHSRWIELEDALLAASNTGNIQEIKVTYAIYVLKHRWPEIEYQRYNDYSNSKAFGAGPFREYHKHFNIPIPITRDNNYIPKDTK